MLAKQAAFTPDMQAFLATHKRSFVMNFRKDGSPTGHPLTAQVINGVLYYNTYRQSAKMRNILRDGRVACLITTDDGEESVKSLVIRGRAVMIEDPKEALAIMASRASPARASVSPSPAASTQQQRILDGRRVMMRIDPTEIYWQAG